MVCKEKTSTLRQIVASAILPSLLLGCSFIQVSATEPASPTDETEVYTCVEKSAEFPGGMTELMKFLANNIRYPQEASKAREEGRVIVNFKVMADGSIKDAKVIKGVSPSLDEEALRVVNAMPKWTPGKMNGKTVASYFTLPVSFRLHQEPIQESPSE